MSSIDLNCNANIIVIRVGWWRWRDDIFVIGLLHDNIFRMVHSKWRGVKSSLRLKLPQFVCVCVCVWTFFTEWNTLNAIISYRNGKPFRKTLPLRISEKNWRNKRKEKKMKRWSEKQSYSSRMVQKVIRRHKVKWFSLASCFTSDWGFSPLVYFQWP